MVVDIATEIKEIFGKMMVTTCFGDDISMEEVSLLVKPSKEADYEEKSFPFWQSIEEVHF